jgi:hypothetical protein
MNYISEQQDNNKKETDQNNNQLDDDNILEEDEYEDDFPMPDDYKKYNIDGVPKKRKSSVNP